MLPFISIYLSSLLLVSNVNVLHLVFFRTPGAKVRNICEMPSKYDELCTKQLRIAKQIAFEV